jgi:hypothetical protein
MKKNNHAVSWCTLIATGFLAVACGKVNSHYSSSGSSIAGSRATTQTATILQGEWTNCTAGILITYSFVNNGYWTETDTYSSNDCSDANPESNGQPEEGTFQLASTTPTAGTMQAVTFIPYSASTDSDGASQSGYVAIAGPYLFLSKNNLPQMTFTSTTANTN